MAEGEQSRCAGSMCCSKAQPRDIGNEDEIELEITEVEPKLSIADSLLNDTAYAKEVRLLIYGMDCAGCGAAVSQQVIELPGIIRHSVNTISSELVLQYQPDITAVEDIMQALNLAGHRCELSLPGGNSTLAGLHKTWDRADLRDRCIFSLLCSLPLFFLQWSGDSSEVNITVLFHGLYLRDVVELILACMLMYLSRRFYFSACRAARAGTTNLDVLISCGVVAAFAYSIMSVVISLWTAGQTRPQSIFDVVGELISVTFLGRWLEACANCQTTSALSSLLARTPQTAVRIIDHQEVLVDCNSLVADDLLLLKSGNICPADCIIESGQCIIDESALTGDIMPVDKVCGDQIFAGTINVSGFVKCRVHRAGHETKMNRIVRLLIDAQANKASIQYLADRLAAYLVPIVLSLSLCTCMVWFYLDPSRYADQLEEHTGRVLLSLKLAIAVLVISCPCSLSVATPTAVAVGVGIAAKLGILIKGADVLEKLTGVTDIVFDKTGTLTTGILSVSEVVYTNDAQRMLGSLNLWAMLASAETLLGSSHPISVAIMDYAVQLHEFDEFSQEILQDLVGIPGQGFTCTYNGATTQTSHRLVVGTLALLVRHGVELISKETICGRGGTRVYVAVDGKSMCTIYFTDCIRSEARRTVQALLAMQKTVWMLTGDNQSAAEMVAQQVGISEHNLVSAASVESKAQMISALQQRGHVVAFCGDGINDVLALVTSDVGISIAGSTEAAMASASIVISGKNPLQKIISSCQLAKDVFTRVRINLCCALAWNVVVIPTAMGCFLPWDIYVSPVLACIIMSLSCISIIGSSLTLRYTALSTLDD